MYKECNNDPKELDCCPLFTSNNLYISSIFRTFVYIKRYANNINYFSGACLISLIISSFSNGLFKFIYSGNLKLNYFTSILNDYIPFLTNYL